MAQVQHDPDLEAQLYEKCGFRRPRWASRQLCSLKRTRWRRPIIPPRAPLYLPWENRHGLDHSLRTRRTERMTIGMFGRSWKPCGKRAWTCP